MLSTDITIVINGVESTGLPATDELTRAVVISLFTWRRANPDDVTEGQKMGWWGDLSAHVTNDRIGSRLWLLMREKILPQTIQRAREYAQESLQWLIEDGVASRVDVTAERRGLDGIALAATIYRTDGRTVALKFDNAWEIIRAV